MIQVTILPRSGLKSRTRRTGPVSYGVAIYELVTYKWPTWPWLRSNREKQRIIWAYKILFLYVLFPTGMSLYKAILSMPI
jgi:hypothetical protein